MSLDIIKKTDTPEPVQASDIFEWFKGLSKKKKANLTLTDEALNLINTSIQDPEFDGFKFIDTLITYQNALENDRVSLEDYVKAIRFTAFLEVEEGNAVKAYIRAFADRAFVQERMYADTSSKEYKELSSAATRYRKTPLVVNILTQAEVPLYLMFQGYRYKAVKVLADTMLNAKYDRDKIAAADKLLTHVKPPENVKIELDVGVKKDNIVDEYESMLAGLITEQKKLLEQNKNVADIANIKHNYTEAEILNG